MFYSHEILTSREHGVATVWLVATLGAKSTARKVNRKAILDVDVPKACDTIMRPEAPMALRLQGNLLYGLSRVYNQQCGYTLTDAQAMHDRMKTMLKIVQGTGLDPGAGKARPDQLVVPYDPTFMLDTDLPGLYFDLVALDNATETGSSRRSSLLSTTNPASTHSSQLEDNLLQLEISSSDIALRDVGMFGSVGDMSSSAQKGDQFDRALNFDVEEGVLLQPDFEFDEEGNIVELVKQRPQHIVEQGRSQNLSEALATRQVREELGEAYLVGEVQSGEPMHLDEDNVALVPDDLDILPPSEPFPKRGRLPDPDYIEEAARAPPRKRVARNLAIDQHPELRNADLAQSNYEYLQNMAVALKQKQQNKMLTQAKRNAAFWVFGQGIGSVGVGLGASRVEHPLSCFSGEQLLAAVQGIEARRERKRSHSFDEDSESGSESRRVRRREDEDQIGRGEDVEFGDADKVAYEDIEIGRQGPPSLQDDHSSQMPWNLTASIRGSRHGSSVPSLPRGLGSAGEFSRGRPGSVVPGPLDPGTQFTGFGRPGSRLTSASPLAGRGFTGLAGRDVFSSLSIIGNEGDDIDVLGDFDLDTYLEGELEADRLASAAEGHDSFQLFGPAAAVDTQTAAQSQWVASVLDQESRNFLEFVKNKIESLPAAQIDMDERHTDTSDDGPIQETSGSKEITFSALLPPETNTRVVATQGLMHVLTLATKGIMSVRQAETAPNVDAEGGNEEQGSFAEIFLRVNDA